LSFGNGVFFFFFPFRVPLVIPEQPYIGFYSLDLNRVSPS